MRGFCLHEELCWEFDQGSILDVSRNFLGSMYLYASAKFDNLYTNKKNNVDEMWNLGYNKWNLSIIRNS